MRDTAANRSSKVSSSQAHRQRCLLARSRCCDKVSAFTACAGQSRPAEPVSVKLSKVAKHRRQLDTVAGYHKRRQVTCEVFCTRQRAGTPGGDLHTPDGTYKQSLTANMFSTATSSWASGASMSEARLLSTAFGFAATLLSGAPRQPAHL